MTLPCGHTHCKACLLAWLASCALKAEAPFCPCCRKLINTPAAGLCVTLAVRDAILARRG